MAFVFFILVNAVLFVRPAELVPALGSIPAYELLMLCSLFLAAPGLARQFTPQSLQTQTITVCVFGIQAGVVLSHLARGSLWAARASGVIFFKIFLYYLLVIAVSSTTSRLEQLLRCIVLFAVLLAGLSLLQYHGIINIDALQAIQQTSIDPVTGEESSFPRLQSTGIFNDPNDLALILVFGMVGAAYCVSDPAGGPGRHLWYIIISLLAYALVLTYSRGGMIGMAAAMLVLFCSRFGWRKALVACALVAPPLIVVFGSRQGGADLESGTSQERIQIWSQGLDLFSRHPLFGIGMGTYAEAVGHVAHNSFIECYTELGLFGGTFFLGAVYSAISTVHGIRSEDAELQRIDPKLHRLRPFLLAAVTGYAVGMLSLSRGYTVPVYLVLGVAAAYVKLVSQVRLQAVPRLNLGVALRLASMSVLFVIGASLFIRLFARWR